MEEQEGNTLARCCMVLRFFKVLLPSVLRKIAAVNHYSQKWLFASNGFKTPIHRLKFASNENFAPLSSISLVRIWDLQHATLFRLLPFYDPLTGIQNCCSFSTYGFTKMKTGLIKGD